ncbi:MAG: hypothetical protein HY094_05410 [Candidatus Melainabacteria bacterium]|nr:hypothetical protein [Candidatus Melainabacteria bacterium]
MESPRIRVMIIPQQGFNTPDNLNDKPIINLADALRKSTKQNLETQSRYMSIGQDLNTLG